MIRNYTVAALLVTICFFGPLTAIEAQEAQQLTPAAAAEKELIDQAEIDRKKAAAESKKVIVASVEGTDISMYDLVRMMNRVASAYYADVEILTPEINKEIQERALDRLIFEELAVREARRQKIVIDPEKIDKVVDETRKLYPTEAEYQKYLDGIGLNEEQLLARVERRRLLQAVTGKEIYQKVTIDPKDVDRLYKEYLEAGRLKMADEFFIKDILILEGKDKDTEMATAQLLLHRLKKYDYDFGKLVLDGTFIVRDLRVKKDKLPVIFKAMESMEKDDISDVVEDGGSYHIFKVRKNELGRDMTREEANDLLSDRLGPYAQEKRRVAWMKELKKDAEITVYEDKLEEMIGK